jgi:hypothetical protein
MMGWADYNFQGSEPPPYVHVESNGAVSPPPAPDEAPQAREAFIILNREHIVADYVSRLPSDAREQDKPVVARIIEKAFDAGVKSERSGTCIPEAILNEINQVVNAAMLEAEYRAPDQIDFVGVQARSAFWRGMSCERKAQTKWGVYVDPKTQPASRHQFFS